MKIYFIKFLYQILFTKIDEEPLKTATDWYEIEPMWIS